MKAQSQSSLGSFFKSSSQNSQPSKVVAPVKKTPEPLVRDLNEEKKVRTMEVPEKALDRKALEEAVYRDRSNLRGLKEKGWCPMKDCPFEKGQQTPFFFVCECLSEVEKCKGENSKDIMKEIISNMFRGIMVNKRDELWIAFNFCTTRIDAEHLQAETGIGSETLVKAAARVTGRSEKQIRDSVAQIGDLGKVVETGKGSQKKVENFFVKNTKKLTLTLSFVFYSLRRLSEITGNKSNMEKETLIVNLLNDAKPEEAKFIIRFLQKNIKVGAAEKTFQGGLTRAFIITPPNGKVMDCRLQKDFNKEAFGEECDKLDKLFQRAINQHPIHREVINHLIEIEDDHESLLERCKLSVGVPCKPMLAKPTKEIGIIFKRFEGQKFTCEFKYDGLRGQVHHSKAGEFKIYSRNLEDLTGTYPDIIEVLKEHGPKDVSFILDSEIVAVDAKTGKILPFQILSTRARKNVEIQNIDINVCVYLFDLILFDDESLLQCTLENRRKIMKKNFNEVPSKICYAQSKDSENLDEIQEFLLESVKRKITSEMGRGRTQTSLVCLWSRWL